MHIPEVSADLRQGDVCTVPSIPIWSLAQSSTVSGGLVNGIVLPNWDKTAKFGDEYLVAVCTQCCDLENPRARTGVALAPLMRIPATPDTDQYERIMGSAQPDLLGRYEYVNLFPLVLPADSPLPLVADFSAIITMATMKAAIPRLMAARRFAMSASERTAFREKLGFMFGRDPDARAPELN